MHVCNATCALQCLIQHNRGEENWKGQCGCILFKKQSIFMWTSSNCTTKPLHTQWKRIFSSFLVRNFCISCCLQNSVSIDQRLLTNFTFFSYCLLAFTSLNSTRTFCAYLIFSDEFLEYNKVIVSWDLLTVFLTAPFYSPSTLTHTPQGNNQQKMEDPLETRQSNSRFLKEQISNPSLSISSLSDWLIGALCSPIICPFLSQRNFFQQC